MRLTFLSAGNGRRLSKIFTETETKSYPRVKNFTSHFEDNVETIEDMYAALRKHAAEGNCLLKGQLDEPLVNESRRGKVDRDTPTGFLVIDFDNINLGEEFNPPSEWNEDVLNAITEHLLSKLPEEFQNASYISQASASFGRKGAQIGCHVFFILETFAHPRTLKDAVTALNFKGYWKDRLTLSATGTALSYPIDRTVCDNSRLIYISPPQFQHSNGINSTDNIRGNPELGRTQYDEQSDSRGETTDTTVSDNAARTGTADNGGGRSDGNNADEQRSSSLDEQSSSDSASEAPGAGHSAPTENPATASDNPSNRERQILGSPSSQQTGAGSAKKAGTDPCRGWDRFSLVVKEQPTLNIEQLLKDASPDKVSRQNKAQINRLRREIGMRTRKENVKEIRIEDQYVQVVMNPDRMKMIPALDEGEFVRYNVNDGDSAAYWGHKHSPDIVYNFKGEPNFSFKAADPEGYERHRSEFGIELDDVEEGHTPLMFADKDTGKYYFGRYLHDRQEMDYLTQMPKSTLPDFAASEGLLMPDNIDVWRYNFEPFNEVTIDFRNKFLNKYIAPKHLTDPADIPDEYKGVLTGYAADILQKNCPVIYKIMSSVCGNGVTELEYFVNWLAFVTQNKRKAMTAWVFHGVPGTGKGLLFHHVLAPLLGEKYVQMKRQQDIEEKFNGWMEHNLLFIVDEFRVENSQRGSQNAIVNKLKNMITETRGTIRAMGTDQQERPLYSNMIFFSNDRDAVRIQEGDRRFNIAPRQEQPIIKRYPELFEKDVIKHGCREELPFLATFLLEFEVDENAVVIPLENQAKQEMQVAAFTAADEFVDAFAKGNLDYFLPILEETLLTNNSDYLIAAKNVLHDIIKNYDPLVDTPMFVSELRPLYNVLCGKAENEAKFAKLLTRHGLSLERIRKNGMNRRGVRVHWKLKENTIDQVRSVFALEVPDIKQRSA